MKIRQETKADERIVEEIIREAFWNLYVPGCDEHYLAHCMRNHPDFISEMNFVAELENGEVVGSIMYSKSYVIDEQENKIDTVTFGPLCVLPKYQRKGIGTALINHTKEIAIKNNVAAIIILGHPHNYCKHGFKNTRDFNITDAEGNYPYGQLVLELKKDVFANKKWKFITSPVFYLDPKKAQEFDKKFPPKAKKYQPSQEEFSIAVRATLK